MGYWKNIAKVVTYPIVHPQRTIGGAIKGVKTAAIGIPAGYIGWEKLTTDKSIARITGEAIVGERAVNAMSDAVGDVGELKDSANKMIDKVSEAGESLGGINSFFQNMFSGNGGNMIRDFVSNLGKGKISGLGIVGLIGAAVMIFGRFGWFGKIAGGLLAMAIIGNNSLGKSCPEKTAEKAYSRASVYSPKDDTSRVFVKAWDQKGNELPAIEIKKETYDNLVKEGYSPMQIYQGMTELEKENQQRGNSLSR